MHLSNINYYTLDVFPMQINREDFSPSSKYKYTPRKTKHLKQNIDISKML